METSCAEPADLDPMKLPGVSVPTASENCPNTDTLALVISLGPLYIADVSVSPYFTLKGRGIMRDGLTGPRDGG
jgi:hypothetical protein